MTTSLQRVLFATSNEHKVQEVRAILGELGIDIVALDSLQELPPEPVEDGDTFEANAAIKAIAYARATGTVCLADDSGLEVDALDGAPGVHSARYAGIGATRPERDAANNAKLLQALRDVPPEARGARFVCCMCLADPDGRTIAESRGTFDGMIIDAPRGENGFGYDPLLFVPDAGCTSAELPTAEKNRRSHRGRAARALVAMLRTSSPGTAASRQSSE